MRSQPVTTSFLEKFNQFIQKHNLIQSRERVLVAVSGGMDSIVLTDLILKLSVQFPVEIMVAHLNHELRGEEADEDEAFVKTYCRQRRITCFTGHENVSEFSRTHKMSVETAARECRYRFLQKIAVNQGCDKIATGHSANDQAETIVDHFMRGSGVRGLCGMPPVQGNIIRPLLFAARTDIEQYASENNLPYRIDSTNLDTHFKRNRIRHMLLPMMQRHFNPAITMTIHRMGAVMKEIDQYLYQQAETALQECVRRKTPTKIILDIHQYLAYFNVIQKYMLFCAFTELVHEARYVTFETFDRLDTAVEKRLAGKYIIISDDLKIYIGQDELVIQHDTGESKIVNIAQLSGVHHLWDGYSLEIKREEKTLSQLQSNKNPSTEWIDADLIHTPMVIRTMKPGDFFYPLNFKGSKKLSDFFIDCKIPVYERSDIPIVETQNHIVWIGGCRLDDRFKVTQKTQNIVSLTLRQNT